MYKGQKIAVVVPCFNEQEHIGKVIETMPEFVDKIVAVDDNSTDNTPLELREYVKKMGQRLISIRHPKKIGVGGAIVTGYKWCKDNSFDVVAVMAGDNQMDPQELSHIIDPVVEGVVDYCKGNRFKNGQVWRYLSPTRYIGSAILTLFTKVVSGYWHISDSQSGYTAISLDALERIDLEEVYSSYGMPNDMLVKLNVAECRVKDIAIRPIYHTENNSKMRLYKVFFSIPLLLLRLFIWRMKEKYVIRDFHPLIFFYLLAAILLPAGIILGIIILYFNTALFGYHAAHLQIGWIILCSLFFISGFQFLLFAMWFDMDYNKHLYVFEERSKGKM